MMHRSLTKACKAGSAPFAPAVLNPAVDTTISDSEITSNTFWDNTPVSPQHSDQHYLRLFYRQNNSAGDPEPVVSLERTNGLGYFDSGSMRFLALPVPRRFVTMQTESKFRVVPMLLAGCGALILSACTMNPYLSPESRANRTLSDETARNHSSGRSLQFIDARLIRSNDEAFL